MLVSVPVAVILFGAPDVSVAAPGTTIPRGHWPVRAQWHFSFRSSHFWLVRKRGDIFTVIFVADLVLPPERPDHIAGNPGRRSCVPFRTH